jgi:hypothetical protein
MSDHSESGALSFHRRIAAHCNNSAWDLIEREILDAGDCVALVRLAATAAHHWREIGTSDNIANAELLLAWALARAGAGLAAVDAASRAFKHFSEKKSEQPQMAFSHAAMAVSLHSAGDRESAALRRGQATGNQFANGRYEILRGGVSQHTATC